MLHNINVSNIVPEWLAVLLCIQDVCGLNLSLETSYSNGFFLCFLDHPGKCWNSPLI
jgi:hypothetical protein